MQAAAGSRWSAISSVDFSAGYGLAGLAPDQMVMYISIQPSYGSPSDYLQRRLSSLNGGQAAWQSIDLNGVTASIQTTSALPLSPQTVLIPAKAGLLTVAKYPFSSAYDATFMQILKTIRLK
jgi:hypothetical protein